MNFKPLQDTPISIIAHTFHRAFEGYFVPMEMTAEKLRQKIQAEGIDLSLSVGAFEGDILVGFMLHAADMVKGVKTAYNAGTGVLPDYRGQQLTAAMYAYSLPILAATGIISVQMEVIEENTAAIKSYQKAGFSVIRGLPCYKGVINRSPIHNYVIEEITYTATLPLHEHFDWQPAWQNAVHTLITADPGSLKTWGIKTGGELTAYITYTPGSNRIHQFAVHKSHRRKGAGAALLIHAAREQKLPLTLINVDGNDPSTNDFLKSMGLEPFITQYEMGRRLD